MKKYTYAYRVDILSVECKLVDSLKYNITYYRPYTPREIAFKLFRNMNQIRKFARYLKTTGINASLIIYSFKRDSIDTVSIGKGLRGGDFNK